MNFIDELSAVVLLFDFLVGVTFGVLGAVAYGSRLEDADRSLVGDAPDHVSGGVRVLLGLRVRDDGQLRRLLAGGEPVPAGARDGYRRIAGSEPER